MGGPMAWVRSPCIMGIVNVTPDSFSEDGLAHDGEKAYARVQALAGEGAAICDVGAESTKPGSQRVPAREQLRRLKPLIAAMHARPPRIPVSIDTTHTEVAAAMLDAGAVVVNDVSGGREDPAILELVGERGAAVVLMHMRGQPVDMQDAPVYEDVVGEVHDFLAQRIEAAVAAGVDRSRVLVDPGIGFGKTLDHNLTLIGNLERFRSLDAPIVVGLSRKGMIGTLTGRGVRDRLVGSISGALAAVRRGASVVRVHDVAETLDALAVWSAVERAEDHHG